MKAQTLSLIPVLALGALAHPGAKPFDAGPITQQSHVTAFIITDEGVKVECWSIGNLLPQSSSRSSRRGGQVGPNIMPMYNDELQGVDLLTWPEPAPWWPEPKSARGLARGTDLSGNIYTVQGGLVNIKVASPINAADDDDDDGQYIFSAENGDNWFYFEDSTWNDDYDVKTCADSKGPGSKRAHSRGDEPPLTASTRSADGTTLIQFKYDSTPTHEVLHPGRCRFTGLVNVGDDSSRRFKHEF